MNIDYFNENVFKTFWEAKRGQVCLLTINSSRFHEHVEALEEDPCFSNYNTFRLKKEISKVLTCLKSLSILLKICLDTIYKVIFWFNKYKLLYILIVFTNYFYI